jgi:protein subunit release factor A
MYLSKSQRSSSTRALELLESAAAGPATFSQKDSEIHASFEKDIRELAKEIEKHNPSLAQLLLGMDGSLSAVVHGQN